MGSGFSETGGGGRGLRRAYSCEAAQPPPHNHGEFSYTCHVTVGKFNKPASIEVLVRSMAYRVAKPKMVRSEEPLVRWGDDPVKAWDAVLAKALQKLDSE